MIELIAFFKRKRGLTVDEFQRHWTTRHAELVVRQVGLRRYVQNHTLASGYRKGEPDYDGVAQAWFDDTQALRALAPTREFAAVRADEAEFIEPSSMGFVLTDEIPIVDEVPPAEAAKFIAFLNKRADLDFHKFSRHWREKHGPIAAGIPGIRRYVQCHARPGIQASGQQPIYDGVPMSWFDDPEALRASGQSAAYGATRADEVHFLEPGRLPFVIARELEIPLG